MSVNQVLAATWLMIAIVLQTGGMMSDLLTIAVTKARYAPARIGKREIIIVMKLPAAIIR